MCCECMNWIHVTRDEVLWWGLVNAGKFLEQLRHYQFLKENSVLWSWLHHSSNRGRHISHSRQRGRFACGLKSCPGGVTPVPLNTYHSIHADDRVYLVGTATAEREKQSLVNQLITNIITGSFENRDISNW